MNFQELCNKAIGELVRLTGIKVSENASEAEILAEIEQIPSLAEQNESLSVSLDVVSEELAKVKEQLGKIQPGISEAQMSEAINKALVDFATSTIAPIKESFASEIKALKDLAEVSKVPAGQPLDATIESSTEKHKPEPVQKSVKAFGRERVIR